MPETQQNQNESANQLQPGTFNEVLNSLTGMNKWVASKIINNDFSTKVSQILASQAASAARDAIKNLLETTAQKAAYAVLLKIIIIPIILVCALAIPIIIVTLTAGGNVVIPIAVTLVLIVLIRLLPGRNPRCLPAGYPAYYSRLLTVK